jgi:hypothetical protein
LDGEKDQPGAISDIHVPLFVGLDRRGVYLKQFAYAASSLDPCAFQIVKLN